MNKLKVLIISAEIWRHDSNGGNVLSCMFDGFDWDFAQIFCTPGTPDNGICKRYYQMTDNMAIFSILGRGQMGRSFELDDENQEEENVLSEQPKKGFYKFFKNHRLPFFYFLKHRIWNLSKWKNERLQKFVNDFSPDVIFAPCYGDKFMLRLTRYVYGLTHKPIISYISDDNYTLRQFNLSLFYWIDRFSVRREMRKTFPLYSLVYTMTEAQKKQCERDFNANMKILLKPVKTVNTEIKKEVQSPIKIVYAGGIYINRWKVLAKIAKTIKKINKEQQKIRLDIYTQNDVSKRIYKKLNDGENVATHKSVSSKELFEIYKSSDIALHVESFNLKNRLAVRMSFSTKITDLLVSGCAVMAVCDKKQGGYQYLESENAAICVDSTKKLFRVLDRIAKTPDILEQYRMAALDCVNKNHNYDTVHKMIENDFINIAEGNAVKVQ